MRSGKWLRSLLFGFLLSSALVLSLAANATAATEPLRIGVFADLHAHDTESPGEGKVMSNYSERLESFVVAANAWPADLVIELGDFVNGKFVLGAELGDAARIPGILEKAESIYATFGGPRYYVLGNHDVYDLSKEEFIERVDATSTYQSLDAGAYHVVILDAQYDKKGNDLGHAGWVVQGNIPQAQLDWLSEDLAATDLPTIVCVHQPLDVDFDLLSGGPAIANAEAVKAILSGSGVVVAVFQGHEHENAYSEIDGIHYITFEALVDHTESVPPSWALVTLDPVSRTIDIEGAGMQADWHFEY
ncbi:MAG TPA: metallophosphoesterase [Candidatus Heimdallarchaeota archaeon]|nr:metallophosphoesterase [Candidatus Heimdallarchaeota archaeon]